MVELIKLAPFTADAGEHDGNMFVLFKCCLKSGRVGYPLDELVPNPTLIVLDERYGNNIHVSSTNRGVHHTLVSLLCAQLTRLPID
jgi:hypothetical protein